MKKFLAIVLTALMVLSLAACTGNQNESTSAQTTQADTQGQTEGTTEGNSDEAPAVKMGFIFLHDENSTYDNNFLQGAVEACQAAGIEYVLKTNTPEGNKCYEAALDLVDDGCTIVFADSFGHEDYMIQAAKECPNVQFAHATGTKAHTEGLPNYHNAFASIYEGRYIAGVAAGLKLNAMIAEGKITAEEAKIGYIGAFTYAEVISGYTSFFLGARSQCPSATMEVTFTGSWYDETLEKEAAEKLIADKCVLISQHADSMGAPTACENAGVPNVSYNGSTVAACPNTFIVASRINWAPYFAFLIDCVSNGKEIPADWTGTIGTGSVVLTDVNAQAAAEGTAEKLAEVQAKLVDGSLKVFDTTTFTKDGAALTSYMADVDTDPAYTPDTEVIKDGAFCESEFRSAPYFDVQIDGITFVGDPKF